MALQLNLPLHLPFFLEQAVNIIQQRLNLFTQGFSYIHIKILIVLTLEINLGIFSSQWILLPDFCSETGKQIYTFKIYGPTWKINIIIADTILKLQAPEEPWLNELDSHSFYFQKPMNKISIDLYSYLHKTKKESYHLLS